MLGIPANTKVYTFLIDLRYELLDELTMIRFVNNNTEVSQKRLYHVQSILQAIEIVIPLMDEVINTDTPYNRILHNKNRQHRHNDLTTHVYKNPKTV